jgi:hypothetical protein
MTHLTLAQLAPAAFTALAGVAMVKLGASKHMLVVRRPRRCAACGLEPQACRCTG